MSSVGSVSQWVQQVKAGDEAAVAKLWNRYYTRLIGLAYRKLRAAPRRVADEEDVVLCVVASFVRRAQQGEFPRVRNRDDLWALLITITERQARNQIRDENRQKRGGGKVKGESVFAGPANSTPYRRIDQVAGREPTPEVAALMTERLRELLDMLDDDELRRIALLKLEGYTNKEVAAQISRAVPTVERRFRLIRRVWSETK